MGRRKEFDEGNRTTINLEKWMLDAAEEMGAPFNSRGRGVRELLDIGIRQAVAAGWLSPPAGMPAEEKRPNQLKIGMMISDDSAGNEYTPGALAQIQGALADMQRQLAELRGDIKKDKMVSNDTKEGTVFTARMVFEMIEKFGFSQAEVAKRIGCGKNAISRWKKRLNDPSFSISEDLQAKLWALKKSLEKK